MCIFVTLYLTFHINLNSTEILTKSTITCKLQYENSHFTQALSATVIYVNFIISSGYLRYFFEKFPQKYLGHLVKRHRFRMHCMPLI